MLPSFRGGELVAGVSETGRTLTYPTAAHRKPRSWISWFFKKNVHLSRYVITNLMHATVKEGPLLLEIPSSTYRSTKMRGHDRLLLFSLPTKMGRTRTISLLRTTLVVSMAGKRFNVKVIQVLSATFEEIEVVFIHEKSITTVTVSENTLNRKAAMRVTKGGGRHVAFCRLTKISKKTRVSVNLRVSSNIRLKYSKKNHFRKMRKK